MRIVLTRLTSSHHRLELHRGKVDPAHESLDLESRSYLLHDLIHYAVEAEANLKDGFWGRLAAGTPLEALNDRERPMGAARDSDLAMAESIVGPVTGLIQGKTDPAGLLRAFHDRFVATGDGVPPWLTEGFLLRVMERMRRLLGHWKATPFRGTLELTWPPEE